MTCIIYLKLKMLLFDYDAKVVLDGKNILSFDCRAVSDDYIRIR